MTQRIAQFAVTVRDYDEAIAFYTERLGFDLLEDTSETASAGYESAPEARPGPASCSHER